MSLRGTTAIVGIGQTPWYKRGASGESEVKLALRAIVSACDDAGIDPRDVDGFVSYGSEMNAGPRLMAGLGTHELRHSAIIWGAGGGGIPGALSLAAMAIATNQAEIVAVYRAMSESFGGRLSTVVFGDRNPAQNLVNGMEAPVQMVALQAQRMLEVDGIPPSTFRAVAQVAYYHAQRNPDAVGHNTDLTDELYEASRFISEPLRLFDCSRENDAGAAVLVVAADRAKDYRQTPAYILSVPYGSPGGSGENEQHREPYTSANMYRVADRMWAESGYRPADVDVAQVYENFTGAAVAAIIDHGFCTRENAGEFITFENLVAPDGRLPINTSGGNIAEGFLHGMGLVPEAVRQIRGTSTNQVPGAKLSLMTGGPSDFLVSSALLGALETL